MIGIVLTIRTLTLIIAKEAHLLVFLYDVHPRRFDQLPKKFFACFFLFPFWCDIDNRICQSIILSLPTSWQNGTLDFLTILCVFFVVNRNCIWCLQSCGERARFQSTSRRVDSVASSASVRDLFYASISIQLIQYKTLLAPFFLVTKCVRVNRESMATQY